MSAGESHGRSRQLRDKAQELDEAATRSTDPDESRRPWTRRRLREQSEQERVIDDPGMDLR